MIDPPPQPGEDDSPAASLADSILTALTYAAEDVVRGDPAATDRVLALAGQADLPDRHRRAAEAIGMMIVKLEAREFDLELRNERLAAANVALEASGRLRGQASLLLTQCILFITGYTLIFAALHDLVSISRTGLVSTLYNLGVVMAMLVACVWMIRYSRLPLRDFGLTLAGWRRAIPESLVGTAVLAVVAILVRWKVADDALADPDFFDWRNLGGGNGITLVAIYAGSSVLQELLARGFLQGMFRRVIISRYADGLSILLASSIFATMHVHLSPLIGLAAFVQGLVFGVLYRRHGTIVGVSLAHFLFGVFSLSILDLDRYLY